MEPAYKYSCGCVVYFVLLRPEANSGRLGRLGVIVFFFFVLSLTKGRVNYTIVYAWQLPLTEENMGENNSELPVLWVLAPMFSL